jgi:hypothetical protein
MPRRIPGKSMKTLRLDSDLCRQAKAHLAVDEEQTKQKTSFEQFVEWLLWKFFKDQQG